MTTRMSQYCKKHPLIQSFPTLVGITRYLCLNLSTAVVSTKNSIINILNTHLKHLTQKNPRKMSSGLALQLLNNERKPNNAHIYTKRCKQQKRQLTATGCCHDAPTMDGRTMAHGTLEAEQRSTSRVSAMAFV